jgi:excisionase family DNA binding protein
MAETDIMTVEELAAYLKVDRQTVYRKFRKGELPGVRIGRAIRFKRDVVDSWLRLASGEWTEERRAELYRWAERFAKDRGITEQDVLEAVRAHRRGER